MVVAKEIDLKVPLATMGVDETTGEGPRHQTPGL